MGQFETLSQVEENDLGLVEFYQRNRFNPVPIRLTDDVEWQDHLKKRENLYENHLRLPLTLFNGQRVVEFGCNSGENSLVLASFGAKMTLVEPNDQVRPEIQKLFKQHHVEDRIEEVRSEYLQDFKADSLYDFAIAEGFLYMIPDWKGAIGHMVKLLRPGGVGVISYVDRHGGFLEFLRRKILFQALKLAKISDPLSTASLQMAHTLFGEEFARIPSSRTLEAWWRDLLVSPVIHSHTNLSFPGVSTVLNALGCRLLGTSPSWDLSQVGSWYKQAKSDRFGLDSWRYVFPYLLTGDRRLLLEQHSLADNSVIKELEEHVAILLDTTFTTEQTETPLPSSFKTYLLQSKQEQLALFGADLVSVYDALHQESLDVLKESYFSASSLRHLWGVPYQYLSFLTPVR